jgi:hypothetical protein
MAVMTPGQRQDTVAELMNEWSADRQSCSLRKAELRAAIDAADQWVSDNAAAFNAALPVAARNALTNAQKAHLLAVVVESRFKRGA